MPDETMPAGPATESTEALHLTVFNPGADGVFPVTSTIVHGRREAMLVDAQFQPRHAKELVRLVEATGRTLKYVFVSHSDPDYYFGLAEITRAFPAVRILSTAQTAHLIAATKDAKLEVWKDTLGDDVPAELVVPEAVTADELVLDGEPILIRRRLDDPAHSYLWIPSSRTILGGIPVTTGGHLWMADSASLSAIDAWLRIIEDMRALAPARVIAGHFQVHDESPEQLEFVKEYLEAYRQAAEAGGPSADVVAAMVARFPDLPGRETLEVGAKVLKGESDWHVASPYPPIGRVAVVDFGDAAFRLHFVDDRTMSFEDTSGAGAFGGVRDTVQYTAVEVAPNVFMTYWHEPATGANVVHVQDWATGTAYTNIAGRDGSFTNLRGTIALA